MTRDEKWEIGIGAGLVAIVLLAAYLHGKNVSGGASTQLSLPDQNSSVPTNASAASAPGISVTYQPGDAYSINVAGPDQVSLGNGTLCSCGCNNAASFFGMDQLLQSYANALNNDTNTYLQTLLSAIPSTISQFINNPSGYDEAEILSAVTMSL